MADGESKGSQVSVPWFFLEALDNDIKTPKPLLYQTYSMLTSYNIDITGLQHNDVYSFDVVYIRSSAYSQTNR